MSEEIYADWVEFVSNGGDAGIVMQGRCPKCGHEMTVSEGGWSTPKCACGYEWSLDLKIVGEK